jgi:phosphatidylserine/phosphatidylglycerophosphate/cardiolipin synthase-like enzyme
MNRKHTIKSPPYVKLLICLSIGFGAGYGTSLTFYANHQTFTKPLPEPQNINSIDVCFTPSKLCQMKIIDEINRAKTSIHVQAYSFTDKEIAEALVSAALRKVSVSILLDKSNRRDNRSAKDIIAPYDIPIRYDSPQGIAHNKIMIIDGNKIISGSYNFSKAAYQRNTENVLIINSPNLAQLYLQNWFGRWKVSLK